MLDLTQRDEDFEGITLDPPVGIQKVSTTHPGGMV